MATAAVPSGSGSLLGRLAARRRSRSTRQPSRRLRKAAAGAAVLVREHLLTVAALAAADLGSFEASRIAGWIVLCPCLLLLDFKLRG